MFFGNKKVNRGFSLIELLIVMSIVAIMSSVGFMSYQDSKRDAILRAAQREVATVIRMAQGYALQGKTQNDGNDFTPCGYGVRFTSSGSYRIFYTKANAGSDCKTDDNYPGTGTTVANNIYTLSDDATISNSPASDVEFYFKVPFGNMLDRNGNSFNGTIIAFEHPSDTGDTMSITINSGGNVTEN